MQSSPPGVNPTPLHRQQRNTRTILSGSDSDTGPLRTRELGEDPFQAVELVDTAYAVSFEPADVLAVGAVAAEGFRDDAEILLAQRTVGFV